MDWINPCGGLHWRTLPNGTVEIEGSGVVTRKPGTDAYENILRTWKNWEPEFRKASREFGVPVSWLVAIAYAETGFVSYDPALQARIESQDGFHSIGIMQPIPSTTLAYGFTLESRYDPLQNIRLGAKIARSNIDRYGDKADFPTVAVSHNAGSRSCQNCQGSRTRCNPSQNRWNIHQYSDYLGTVIPAMNTAKEMGADKASFRGAAMIGGSIALAGLAAAVLIWTGAMPKVQHKLGL